MKKATLLFILIAIFHFQGSSQNLVSTRIAVLQNGSYAFTGNAILENYDNGDLILKLNNDFSTTPGPDVKIYLSNEAMNTSNGVFIENLGYNNGGINHFNGAISFLVPDTVSIDSYEHIIFFCEQFNSFWGTSPFAAETLPEPDPTCIATDTISTLGGSTVAIVSPNNGISDTVHFFNNLNISTENNYAYVICNTQDEIQAITYADSYDFENSGNYDTSRVYGLSFIGDLSYNIGEMVNLIEADTCAILSNEYLTIEKNETITCDTIEMIQSIAGNVNDTICTNDSLPKIISFAIDPNWVFNNNFALVITDYLDTIQSVIFTNSYDFQTSDAINETHVYGISYNGNLNFNLGDYVSDISGENCHMLSESYFIVYKNQCENNVGIELIKEFSIKFGPNPASNKIVFNSALTNIEIYNLSGKLIFNSALAKSIDVSTFEQGLFILRSDEGLAKIQIIH